MKVASADALVAQYAVGRGELSHDEAATAEILDEAAEDGVGDAGHGREHGGGGDREVANLQGRGKHARWCGDGRLARPSRRCMRVIRELLHRLILRPFQLLPRHVECALMKRIREILLTQYIGAITVGFIFAQAAIHFINEIALAFAQYWTI